jgi:hypothetical protein
MEARRIVWTPSNHISVSYVDRSPEIFVGSETVAEEMARKAGLHQTPLPPKTSGRMWVRRSSGVPL